MKTKITVDIHKEGELLYDIINYVAKHNEGKINITQDFIDTIISLQKLKYPSLNKHLRTIKDGSAFYITNEEDSTPFITLMWWDVKILEETENDLLTQQELS